MELDYMKDIDEMAELIKEKEKELLAMKKEYRERRSEGLRNALEQRKEAEKLVREEMKALGVSYSHDSYEFNPFTGWRRLL